MHSFSSGGSGRCSKIKKAKFVLASPFSISRHIVNIFGLLAGCQIHVFPRDSSSPLSPLGTQQVSAFEFHFFFLVSFHSRHFFVLRIHAHPNALSSVVYRLLFFLIFRFFVSFASHQLFSWVQIYGFFFIILQIPEVIWCLSGFRDRLFAYSVTDISIFFCVFGKKDYRNHFGIRSPHVIGSARKD